MISVVLDTNVLVSAHLTRNSKTEKILSLAERQSKMNEIFETHCKKTNITLEELQGGSRTRKVSRLRREIAHVLTEELGIPYAETARQLGVSHVAVTKMMKKESNEY